jgi:hypothetical protein
VPTHAKNHRRHLSKWTNPTRRTSPGVRDSTQVLITFLDPEKLDPIQLRQLIDRLETLLGIQQGFNEVNTGQTRPLSAFIQAMQQKYDISG